MLTRLRIDNYKCFVNFELALDEPLHVWFGPNGSGKSAAGDALSALMAFAVEGVDARKLFGGPTLCRWLRSAEQSIALEAEARGRRYRYELVLDPVGQNAAPRVRSEQLWDGDQQVFEYREGELNVRRGDRKVPFKFDWHRSAFALLHDEPDAPWSGFKRLLEDLWYIKINPAAIRAFAPREDPVLATDLSNFASWLRYQIQEDSRFTAGLSGHFSEVIRGFKALRTEASGDGGREIRFSFERRGVEQTFSLDELSDGQRVLVVLYSLLESLVRRESVLILDEPQNIVSLGEIYPWVLEVRDALVDSRGQVALISHHPQILDALAARCGVLFRMNEAGWASAGRKWAKEQVMPSEWMASRMEHA